MNPDSILNWLVPATIASGILFASALSLVFLLRRSSAAIRHFVLATAFIGAALHAGALLLPKWSWPILDPSLSQVGKVVPFPYIQQDSGAAVISPQALANVPAVPPDPSGIGPGLREIIALVWLAWISGATLVFGRLVLGLLALWRVSGTSREACMPTLENVRASGTARAIIRIAPGIEVPLTWGWLRPEVLLPASFTDWPPEQQRLALAHELAHVRRHDWLLLIVARMVCGMFWFNPLAWISLLRLQAEQEKAADDLVLADARPDAYASALVDFARALQLPARNLPAVPILRSGSLEDRVRSLLNPRASRRRPGFFHRAAMACLFGLLALMPIVQLSARDAAPKSPARQLAKSEERFVGEWQGGGMFPTTFHFKEDGSYDVLAFGQQNLVQGEWYITNENLFVYTSPSNLPPKQRRILQVSSNFFQWQFVGEESKNIFGYHRLTNKELATIAGTVQRQGKPLPDTLVRLDPITPDGKLLPSTEVQSDNDGRFAFHGLPPGLYKVSRAIKWTAQTSQGTTQTATWTHGQLVQVEKDKTSEIAATQGRTLTGELLPPAGMSREQIAFDAGDFRFLTPAQGPKGAQSIVYVMEIKRDGTFTIPDVPPGEYNLFAQVRNMNGPLDADHTATVSTKITVPAGSSDHILGKLPLVAIQR